MALCLCETRYGLFRTVKSYRWKEVVPMGGSPWGDVINKWEKWASAQLNNFSTNPYTFDNSYEDSVTCTPPGASQKKVDTCYLYMMSKVSEDNVEFGIEPEPKETEPKNVQTPPDDFGPELGPFYKGQDPPGNRWDQSPESWEPKQVEPNCPDWCIVPSDGEVLSVDTDLNVTPESWKKATDISPNTHYEDVEVKFWLEWKRQEKMGYERTCCNSNGINSGLFDYENGWQYVVPDPKYPNSHGGKFYEPDWSGEPTITVPVLYNLFYYEYVQLLRMKRKHACL